MRGGKRLPSWRSNMSVDRFDSTRPKRPAGFGPVQPHMSAGGEDHEQGRREPIKKAVGGKVPRLDPNRVVPEVSLAEQFRARLAEAPKRPRKGR